MPQRPKEKIRTAIVAAALQAFSDVGVEGATLAAIASEAGTSIGNLYKYFSSKEALFDAVISADLVQALRRLLRQRVEALGVEHDAHALSPGHPYRLASEELIRFALKHRPEIVFLLRRTENTPYEGFSETLARELTRLAVRYGKRAYPGFKINPARRRMLDRIYRSFLEQVASILAEETTDRALREATEFFAAYHLAGLRAFFGVARPRSTTVSS